MHPEVEELRPKLKEILYDCAVEIRATKAALYLYDGASRFELVTEYGFRGAIRPTADFNDPLVDRCGRGRTPFFVNGLATEPRFSQLLYDTSTDRLLGAPLYSRGKLVGFIDMRDKAAKAAFEKEDLAKAQRIAERLVDLFGAKNVFGHRFIELSGAHEVAAAPPAPAPAPAPAPPPAPAPEPTPVVAAAPPAPPHVMPSLATLVLEARSVASRIIVAQQTDALGEHELVPVREALRAILLIPGAVAATFSAFGSGVQEIASRSTLTEEAKNLLQSKLNVWLTKRGEAGGFLRTSVQTPFGTSGAPIGAADVQKVFTAPLQVGAMHGLYLTVAFTGNPDRVAHELMAVLHAHLQLVIEQASQRGALGTLQARVAAKLVEPDFAKYADLRRHSESTAKLTEAFAQFLALSPAEVESARITALVHDCGMRLLDYDRLYRKRDLSPEEIGFLREHPVVGAALVEPLLGAEIARAVLCHHERVDGRGYPNELHGEEIPLLSRIVQICDAYVTMIDPHGYQPAEPPESALTTVAAAAGAQFDGKLAHRFVDLMRTRV